MKSCPFPVAGSLHCHLITALIALEEQRQALGSVRVLEEAWEAAGQKRRSRNPRNSGPSSLSKDMSQRESLVLDGGGGHKLSGVSTQRGILRVAESHGTQAKFGTFVCLVK